VLTQHNDVARTGAYLQERELTPEAVRVRGMRLVRRIPTGAPVGVQLLYLHGLNFKGQRRNVVLAATAANTVLAIDVHDGTTLWVDSLRDREHAGRNLPRPLTSTPVIDPLTRRMYVVYSTKNRARDLIPPGSAEPESSLDGLDVAFWLVALDVETGRQLLARKIAATTQRSDGSRLSFVGKNHRNRPALLLSHGSVYVAFGARPKEEEIEYHGWVMRYDAHTLVQQGVFCTSRDARGHPPDSAAVGQGAGIWQGNAGLAADSIGQVYLLSGNARAEPARGWFGNSFIKLAGGRDGELMPAGSFSPEGLDRRLERYDWDLGSGGPLVIPGTSLVAGGGKTGTVYLIDAKTMRPRQSFQAARDMYARTGVGMASDTAWYAGPQLYGSLTFWRGPDRRFSYVYLWGARDHLRAYRLRWATQLFDTIPAAVGRRLMPLGDSTGVIAGGMLSLSADGTSANTGILWATLRAAPRAGYLLAAFDAETLEELWSIRLPALSYLQPPTVASGMVIVATRSDDAKGIPEIRVYALDGAAESQ
jgi:outer membrane protein assembly factor BamB